MLGIMFAKKAEKKYTKLQRFMGEPSLLYERTGSKAYPSCKIKSRTMVFIGNLTSIPTTVTHKITKSSTMADKV
jgi:hypothetical protein